MKEVNKFDYILAIMVALIMFGVIGGALVPARLFAILLIPLLLKKWKDCRYIKLFVVFFVVFYAFCLLSMIWTPDIIQGSKELVYYPIHIIYFLEILVFSKYAKNPTKSLSWGWTMTVFFCSFIALWELSTDNHLSIAKQESDELANIGEGILVQHLTASATFYNPNSYITHLCYCFPWIVYLVLIGEKGFVKRCVLFFSILMSVVVIFFNMSRGGLLAFGIMGLAYMLFSPKSVRKLFVAGIIIFFVIYVVVHFGQDALLILQARASDGGLTHDEARFSIWKVALNVLSDYWYVGVGIGGITAALSSASKAIVASPHSLFFEVLVQYGIIFTAIFLIFMLKVFKNAWRLKECDRKTALMMSLFAMPAYTIIDSSYLLGVNFFALIGTIYVFIHIDSIKTGINSFIKEPIKNESHNIKLRINKSNIVSL